MTPAARLDLVPVGLSTEHLLVGVLRGPLGDELAHTEQLYADTAEGRADAYVELCAEALAQHRNVVDETRKQTYGEAWHALLDDADGALTEDAHRWRAALHVVSALTVWRASPGGIDLAYYFADGSCAAYRWDSTSQRYRRAP